MIYGWEESDSGLLLPVKITAPPTRAETIKEAWSIAGEDMGDDDEMIVEHDQGIVPPIVFKRITYAAATVIEAEGVIVARL